MLKQLLTKTLLVAAGLLGGMNAWAEDTYEIVYTRATVSSWGTTDIADWGGNSNLTVDAAHGLFFNPTKPGSAYLATKSFSIEENAKVKYEVSWYVGLSTGRSSNYEYIQFGDRVRISWNSNYFFYLNTDGVSSTDNPIGSKGSNTTYKKSISIIFDTAKKTVESFSFDGIDLSAKVVGTLNGNFNSLTFGFQRGGSTSNWSYPNGLETVTVSQCEQEVTSAGYTINYKLGENVVKTVSSSSTVGSQITADVAVNGEGDYVGNHYLITANTAPSMTLVSNAASNVLNVPVRAPYTATLNVTTTIGENAPSTVITNLVETDAKVCAWSYAYPLYVKSGDVYYKADNTTTFGEGGTFTNGQVIEKSVVYSTTDENVVFFYDQATAGTNYTYTNGTDGNVGAQNARGGSTIRGIGLITLEAGSYEFVTYFTGWNSRGLVLRDNDNATDPIVGLYTDKSDASTAGLHSAAFSVSTETTCVINGANSGDTKTNQSEDFDYVLIKKALPVSVPKSISAAGWATYCSPYALDFEDTGLTAYIVTGADANGVLAKEKVTSVPANTGVLLKGDAGNYDIPVVASSSTDVTLNKMVGVTADTPLAAKSIWVLMGSPKIGFYCNSNAFTVGANTAYIPVDEGNFAAPAETTGAKTRFFSLDGDDATAINGIESEKNADNASIYNLAGQRVNAGYKGIVIKNGKKVLVK